jgi:hypothetical protein
MRNAFKEYGILFLTYFPYFEGIKVGLLNHIAVYVSMYPPPPIFAMQWLSKHVPAATNTQATIEEFLDALFSMWSMSYKRKVSDKFFPKLFVFFYHFYY